MVGALLLGVGMVAVSPSVPPSATVLAVYELASAKTGRDADAHVKLALWCEAHGLPAERAKQLALAVLNNPNQAAARGLLGFVAYQGRWKRPEAVTVQMARDEKAAKTLADYHARRDGLGPDADAQWDLALWCEQQGLADQSRAHLIAVTRLDPARDAAWERLGYVRRDGQWATREQAVAAENQAASRAKADQVWEPRLRAWQSALRDHSSSARRTEVTTALARLNDPAVILPLVATLPKGTVEWQRAAIDVLDRLAVADSTEALVSLAVEGKTSAVRHDAVAALKRRDLLEYGGLVVGRLHSPIIYAVKPVCDFGEDGRLTVDWGDVIEERTYHTPTPILLNSPRLGNPLYVPDAFGRPVMRVFTSKTIGETSGFDGRRFRRYKVVSTKATDIPVGQMWEDRVRSLQTARARQEKDFKVLLARTRAVEHSNKAVVAVLKEVTGKPFSAEAVASWQAWWSEEEGYRYRRPSASVKPVILTEVAPRPYDRARPQTYGVEISYQRASCFAAGTPVWTVAGRRPIESIEVGDRVLAEDPLSCALSYQPVIVANHNPPDATFEVTLDNGDRFTCTGIHRLWLPGKGWVKARDVKPGDILRTLDGPVAVSRVEPNATQPVFNLGLGGRYGLFVGQTGVLAHDDSPIRPTPVLFDDDPAVDPRTSATPDVVPSVRANLRRAAAR